MRNLASIQKIESVDPIIGADRIEKVRVLGWQLVANKGEFKVGDLCVYFEIDSILPALPVFEFMKARDYRVKTIKLRKEISQGLALPLSILPSNKKYKIGDDITETLGVKQYEKYAEVVPVPKKKYPNFLMKFKLFRWLVLPKKSNKSFPSFISKTDETRIQNAPHYLKEETEWVATEKIDGQSGTFALVKIKSKIPILRHIIKDKYEYIVCSRNCRLRYEDNTSYWQVSNKYKIQNVLKNIIGDRDWVALQGECIAPNVQGNKYKVTEPDLFVFNLIYPTGRMNSIIASKICIQHGLKFVPIIDTLILPKTVDEVLTYAHGTSQLYDTLREGIVFRNNDGVSFKAVDPLFLLKHDE